jgi:hypothetical protein
MQQIPIRWQVVQRQNHCIKCQNVYLKLKKLSYSISHENY